MSGRKHPIITALLIMTVFGALFHFFRSICNRCSHHYWTIQRTKGNATGNEGASSLHE